MSVFRTYIRKLTESAVYIFRMLIIELTEILSQ